MATKKYTFRYPDRSRDADAVLVHPKRRQSESLEINRGGSKILLGSEGPKNPVLQIAMTNPRPKSQR